jgi:ABC-2 type transport system ATP-binding protein
MTLGDAAAEPLVHIRNLRTDVGETTVTKDLSFSFALMCSNGSGTTTTLRALLVLRLAVHLFRCWSTEYGRKLSVAGTFRRKELAAK